MNPAEIKRMKEEYEKQCADTARRAKIALERVLLREAKSSVQH